MKLKNSLLLPVIYVFILLFTLTAFFLVENDHNTRMEKEVMLSAEILRNIRNQLLLVQNTNPEDKLMKNSQTSLIINRLKKLDIHYSIQDIRFMLASDDKTIHFSSLTPQQEKIHISYEGLQTHSLDETLYRICHESGKYFIHLRCRVPVLRERSVNLTFYMEREITSVFNQKRTQYLFFAGTGTVILLIFILLASLIISGILTPLNRVIEATTELSRGNYTAVNTGNTPPIELKTLTVNFNSMAQRIQDQMRTLEEENTKKQYFIHSLTHELKTPLTTITGHTDLLLSATLDPAVSIEALNRIYSESKRMESLISQLFLLIVDESVDMVQTDAMNLMKETASIWYSSAKMQGVEIEIRGESFLLRGNISLLKSAFGNIIHNGIKAAAPRGKLTLSLNSNSGIISVNDSGSGVSHSSLSRLREPYYREKGDKKNRGVGLGLSIADEIFKHHGFSMDFFQKEGYGLEIQISTRVYNSETYQKQNICMKDLQ